MKFINFFKTAYDIIKDPDKDFADRIFLILTFMSEIAVLVALIGDILTGESIYEILIIVAVLIFVPAIALICANIDKLQIATRIIVISLVFVIIPSLFFFGGGIEGGGVIWIIFAFMYVGLVLRDKWRNVMFVAISLLTFVCFILEYRHPELIYEHSNGMHYTDFFISLLLVGVVCFVMTWSQRRLFEEENARAKKAAEMAEELSRSQNRFFSSMSHEIRTPINSILGLNELILRDQDASDDIIKDATNIQGSGKLLLALINDILDFSKIEAGSMDIIPVNYRIGDLLSEIVNMLWFKAHEKGLNFEVNVDPNVPNKLYGDEVRIKQLIINLLNNAIKYTQKGRIELRVESNYVDDGVIELIVSVSDTGMGIKKEDIPYLFDAFKRVDEGNNTHIEGTGLGLSIVKQLIELMGGTISVNSVYGEGSTFSFNIRQTVTDKNKVGELNIHNQQVVKRSIYEASFLAPEARILIVDDNEMNLEVESRLLTDTDMVIDTASGGKEALVKCLKIRYDVIFMDHLMPEMDGIECLDRLRSQEGSLNRNTPIVVLTANAGSENRSLYSKAGFDGYLVKPVSGEAMEDALIRHIPGDKIILRDMMKGSDEVINASDRYNEKVPVIIASSSMCDLPDALVKKLHIPIIPFEIKTENGIFKDGQHIDAYELIRHTNAGGEASSSPPSETAYTEFFAKALLKTHHLIYVAITTSMSEDYNIASEAAKAFDNVTVVNSECLSSSTGLLVLIAYKLIQQGLPVEDILKEIDKVKYRLKCSFVIDTTDYMAKKGLVTAGIDRIVKAVNAHPFIQIRRDKAKVGGVWMGRTRRAYKKYIGRALPPDTIPDSDVLFITYADVPWETLKWIEEEVRKVAYFENVIFQQASAAISSNCGPGSFGIMYFLKSNKSYNLASLVTGLGLTSAEAESSKEQEYTDNDIEETYDITAAEEEVAFEEPEAVEDKTELKWYEGIDGIDSEIAIKNSGSEEAFKSVLQIFYKSIEEKYEALEGCYSSKDWENYTIKIHALKSSARLVGAMELGRKAELLEAAGKDSDISYIEENHSIAMSEYQNYKSVLAPFFTEEDQGEDDGKPVADEFLMESIYEELHEAAKNKDREMIEAIMGEIGEYAIPASEKERFEGLSICAQRLDYEGMIQILEITDL